MAKHKAATEITIVQEERSAFAELVDRYKWHGAAVLVVVAAVVLWLQRAGQAAIQEERADWAALYEAQSSTDDPAVAFGEAIKDIDDPSVAAWAVVEKARVEAGEREFEAAKGTLVNLGERGSALLKTVKFPVGPDGQAQTLYASMLGRVEAELEFHNANSRIYSNPPLPENSPIVEFDTSEGKIVVGLYQDLAPQHAQNMLKLVRSSYYDGTLFHRINKGDFIQGGDPNTKEDGDEATWGTGGPGWTVPREESGLKHTTGALAAAKPGGASDSSGSQFYITAKPMHGFDGNYVVYGTVIEGLDVVERISNAETKEDNAERPVAPVKINAARVRE